MNYEELTATGIVRASVRELAANWKMYLHWAVLPMLFGIVVQVVSPWLVKPDMPGWQFFIGLVVLPFLSAWLMAPLILRIHRFVVLGAIPDAYYIMELFRCRTWKYLWRLAVVGSQWLAIYLPGAMVLSYLLIVGSAGSLPKDGAAPSIGFSAVGGFIFLMAAVGAFALVAMRMVLFGPDVAVDGSAKLSYLGKRAAQHRGLIVETVLLTWVVPLFVAIVSFLNQHYKFVELLINNSVTDVVVGLLCSPFYGIMVISMSIMYKEFSKEWPAMDAEEAARTSGEVALKEAKPFNPPPGRSDA